MLLNDDEDWKQIRLNSISAGELKSHGFKADTPADHVLIVGHARGIVGCELYFVNINQHNE